MKNRLDSPKRVESPITTDRKDPRAMRRPALLCLCLLLFPSTMLRAENVITMGYGEGAPGDAGINVIITARNDTPVHGYSLAFTYPADVLTLRSVSTDGTHVQDVEPDFVAPSLDNQLGLGNLGVILSYNEPIELKELPVLPAEDYPRIIARLTFDVQSGAPGGVYPLRLVDGIGQPANYNRFSDSGTSIVPRLEDGIFRVFGGNVLQLEKKIVFGGLNTSVQIDALARHPDPLDGFQIGFTFDKEVLTLTSASYDGTALGLELGRDGLIEAFTYDVDLTYDPDVGRVSVASLFDFLQPFAGQTLSPHLESPPRQSLVTFDFNVSAAAEAKSSFFDLKLADVDIPGAIDNRFIVQAQSLDPQLISGKIYFCLGSLQGRVVDSLTKEPISGVNVVAQPDDHTTTTAVDGTFSLPDLPPGFYELFLSSPGYYPGRHSTGAGGAGAILVSECANPTDIGDIPLYQVPLGTGIRFIRGYINADSKTDLSDAIFLLEYLFRGGGAPTCQLAADINDDNKVDLSDTIFMLNHLFLGGPVPPPPYSVKGEGCAPDPTPGDRLTCEVFICP